MTPYEYKQLTKKRSLLLEKLKTYKSLQILKEDEQFQQLFKYIITIHPRNNFDRLNKTNETDLDVLQEIKRCKWFELLLERIDTNFNVIKELEDIDKTMLQ